MVTDLTNCIHNHIWKPASYLATADSRMQRINNTYNLMNDNHNHHFDTEVICYETLSMPTRIIQKTSLHRKFTEMKPAA